MLACLWDFGAGWCVCVWWADRRTRGFVRRVQVNGGGCDTGTEDIKENDKRSQNAVHGPKNCPVHGSKGRKNRA